MSPLMTAFTYLVSMALSCVVARVAFHVKNRVLKLVLLFLAALPVAVLCGFRDISVGVDTPMYMEAFGHLQLGDEWTYSEWNRFEIGFKWLYRALLNITEEIPIAFFLLYFLTFFVALAGFALIERREDATTAWAFYLLLCMLPGCNAMRQIITLSFSVLACGFYCRRHAFRAVLALLLGCCFHNSGYFYLAFLPILLSGQVFWAYIIGLFVLLAFFTPTIVFLLGYGAYFEIDNGVGYKTGIKTVLALFPFLCILKCDPELRPVITTSVSNKMISCHADVYERLVAFLVVIQVVSIYSDWSLRLTLNGLPFVALMIAFIMRNGLLLSKSYCILYVIYQFGYLCMVCNDNGCNNYLFTSEALW